MKVRIFSLIVIGISYFGGNLFAQQNHLLKDFRGTAQTIAILGASAEFIDPPVKDQILQQIRKNLNRYSRSYGESAISGFKLGVNSNDQFFRPAKGTIGENQKQFLRSASKDNSVDIIGLASIRDMGDSINSEIELQLFDARIETLSTVEVAQFGRLTQQQALEELAYRVMNYLDKDGFVHPEPQNILDKPLTLQSGNTVMAGDSGGAASEVALNPAELGSGTLGGATIIAGDRSPFWEKWWFWTILGSSVGVAGGLSYYFLVVDQPPTKGQIKFTLP